MVNAIMTMSGAWQKLRTDPVLKFIVLSMAFYGLATFEGPMLAIKSVNIVSHFTEWTVGHVHSGALGFNAMLTFGTLYFLVPRLYGRALYSISLANAHFYLAVLGVVLYMCAMWGAGISQGLLWLSADELGEVKYSFVEIMQAISPYYFVRLLGGLVTLIGALLMVYNLYMTIRGARTQRVEVTSPPSVATA